MLFCFDSTRQISHACSEVLMRNLLMIQERPLPWFSWLCSVKCKEVHKGLEHFVLNSPYNIHGSVLSRLKKRAEERGLTSADEAELKWQLLSGTHKTHNEMLFSKATATFQVSFI